MEGGNSEFVTDQDSVLISALLCKPQYSSVLSGQWQSAPREDRTKTKACPFVLQKHYAWAWSDWLKIMHFVSGEIRAQVSRVACLWRAQWAIFPLSHWGPRVPWGKWPTPTSNRISDLCTFNFGLHSVVVQSLSCVGSVRPHGLQHTRLPCPLSSLGEFAQTCVHWIGYAIQPSHPLSFPSPPGLHSELHLNLTWLSLPISFFSSYCEEGEDGEKSSTWHLAPCPYSTEGCIHACFHYGGASRKHDLPLIIGTIISHSTFQSPEVVLQIFQTIMFKLLFDSKFIAFYITNAMESHNSLCSLPLKLILT